MSAGPIATLTRDTERQLADALDLHPMPLEPRMAHATGTLRGAPVEIETSAWTGDVVRYARFATVAGEGLEIGNLLCLPDPRYPLPIFGADLVAARRDMVMFAADLSIVTCDPNERVRQLAALEHALHGAPSLPPGGELPAWCVRWFSPHALYTRFDPAREFTEATQAFAIYPALFAAMARDAIRDTAGSAAIAAAQAGYQAAHREDDKGLRLLAAMFGTEWAAKYIDTVLFPAPIERHGTPGVRAAHRAR